MGSCPDRRHFCMLRPVLVPNALFTSWSRSWSVGARRRERGYTAAVRREADHTDVPGPALEPLRVGLETVPGALPYARFDLTDGGAFVDSGQPSQGLPRRQAAGGTVGTGGVRASRGRRRKEHLPCLSRRADGD